MELRKLLLLKSKGESNRSCEILLGIHRNTINHSVRLFRASGQSYEHPLELDDKQLAKISAGMGTAFCRGTSHWATIRAFSGLLLRAAPPF